MYFKYVKIYFIYLICSIGICSQIFGDLRFEEPMVFPAGGVSTGAFPSDFDNDGDIDFAIASREDNSVRIYLNDGTGTFSDPLFVETGVSPRYVEGGDFDNDGDVDLCTSDFGSDTVSVLLNDGAGIFTLAEQYEAFKPSFLWVDDIDSDGKDDIVALHLNSEDANPDHHPGVVFPLYGNGDATFTQGAIVFTGALPRGGASDDLNGDGQRDIVTADVYSRTISVILSKGNREWDEAIEIPVPDGTPRYVSLGDFDNDGDVDIASLDKLFGFFSILLNDGNAIFTLHETIKVSDSPHSMQLKDVDQDGDVDFVVAHAASESQFILYNNGNANIESMQMLTIPGGTAEVKLADFNADGMFDILTANVNFSANGATVLLQRECLVCAGVRSAVDVCPPITADLEFFLDSYSSIEVQLEGNSIAGNSLSYIVTSIPETGNVKDANGNRITHVPYYLPDNKITFASVYGFVGLETLTYMVNDCVASEESTVLFHVDVSFPDECNSVLEVFNGETQFSTLNATDSLDPFDVTQCLQPGLGEMRKDIWFSYFACEEGQLTVDLCGLVEFEAAMVLYKGSCCELEQIACSSDTEKCNGDVTIFIDSVEADTEYFIRIGGIDESSSGDGIVAITGPSVNCIFTCFGDLTHDGSVGVSDLLLVIDNWGVSCGDADISQDGIVNVVDLLTIIGVWGICD